MDPDRLHARYPFLAAARDAVDRADADLAALVEREGSPVLERALDRVESAIAGDGVGEEHRRARVELLSYPVARVIVSLVDDAELTRAYAAAEARTAAERYTADVESAGLKSTSDGEITLDRLLREFDLAAAVHRVDDGVTVDVGAYLRLAPDLDDDRWALVGRALADGAVPVERAELYDLLEAAVRERVAAGLPLSVPESVADHLTGEVQQIETALADHRPPRGIDAVVPDLFPPCVEDLVRRAREGEDLPDHSAFALVAFCSSVGMDSEDIATLCERDPDTFAYRVERLGESGSDYPPPTCATMDAYGDCVNKDDLCAEIADPLSYYDRRLSGAEAPTD